VVFVGGGSGQAGSGSGVAIGVSGIGDLRGQGEMPGCARGPGKLASRGVEEPRERG